MAQRKPTEDNLEAGDDILDLLPDQDCRSPRPRCKPSATVSCVPVTSERWTDSLLSSMKTLGSFKRRSRPSEGHSELIKAAGPAEFDASALGSASTAIELNDTAKTVYLADSASLSGGHIDPSETNSWPLFSETASATTDRETPAGNAPGTADVASHTHTVQPKPRAPMPLTSDAEHSRIPAAVSESSTSIPAISQSAIQLQLTAAEDDKFTVLARLLASQEVCRLMLRYFPCFQSSHGDQVMSGVVCGIWSMLHAEPAKENISSPATNVLSPGGILLVCWQSSQS